VILLLLLLFDCSLTLVLRLLLLGCIILLFVFRILLKLGKGLKLLKSILSDEGRVGFKRCVFVSTNPEFFFLIDPVSILILELLLTTFPRSVESLLLKLTEGMKDM